MLGSSSKLVLAQACQIYKCLNCLGEWSEEGKTILIYLETLSTINGIARGGKLGWVVLQRQLL